MIQVPLTKIWELDYASKKNLKIIKQVLIQRKLSKFLMTKKSLLLHLGVVIYCGNPQLYSCNHKQNVSKHKTVHNELIISMKLFPTQTHSSLTIKSIPNHNANCLSCSLEYLTIQCKNGTK